MVIDLKEELEQARGIAQKLQQDKRELAEEAKASRAYRDEIEVLKVQSGKVEKLEADIIKYRQKAEDTEYLKKKIAVSHAMLSAFGFNLTCKDFACRRVYLYMWYILIDTL